jgi:DNA-damage-inducible protein J
MTANAIVRARVDQTVKTVASEVLAGIGLTVSDAVRILLNKIARENTPAGFDAERPDRGDAA